MLKELRKMRAKGGKDKAKASYISNLMNKGKLHAHFTEKGYLAYDTEELAAYKATVHLGRPSKLGEKNDDTNK